MGGVFTIYLYNGRNIDFYSAGVTCLDYLLAAMSVIAIVVLAYAFVSVII